MINHRFLARPLELGGFVCRTAWGRAIWYLWTFDLVFVDVHMPVVDGIASTREMWGREANKAWCMPRAYERERDKGAASHRCDNCAH